MDSTTLLKNGKTAGNIITFSMIDHSKSQLPDLYRFAYDVNAATFQMFLFVNLKCISLKCGTMWNALVLKENNYWPIAYRLFHVRWNSSGTYAKRAPEAETCIGGVQTSAVEQMKCARREGNKTKRVSTERRAGPPFRFPEYPPGSFLNILVHDTISASSAALLVGKYVDRPTLVPMHC
ncbi:hypothetical protein EGR_07980 [Echinococcus granulosus]|uniref:Uncharacterized protein n=1 Tax=Echinococcus granulosus TaxID=6210 RepID=W6U7F5_ECHGR|nr:hypothetical protein EGR_07980 [Echinococcus granulosus]EUB57163.1 hypothetical protein EGR_07980 [Echinococcus granulosus]